MLEEVHPKRNGELPPPGGIVRFTGASVTLTMRHPRKSDPRSNSASRRIQCIVELGRLEAALSVRQTLVAPTCPHALSARDLLSLIHR